MLSDVTVGIKTFLRDEKMITAVNGIRHTMPEVNIIVADDGEMTRRKDFGYAQIVEEGHQVILMEYDSGFGAKSNRIAQACKTPYLLIGSDDFDFGEPKVREGIVKMLNVLESYPQLDIVSGRVNNKPYEFYLAEDDGIVEETPCEFSGISLCRDYNVCELTVNYSLIRRNVFNRLRWDDDVKIGGGEHGAFFVDAMRAGFNTAWVPGVNITTLPGVDSFAYQAARSRASRPERPCFDKRGIKKYILGNGQVDYEKK